MDTIFSFMHKMCACLATAVAFVLLDVPIKVISWIIFLVLGLFLSIIYPLIKNAEGPAWLCNWYDYASSNQWIARYVWNAWIY